MLGACGCDGVVTEHVLAVWLFYDLCFRWFADISGFESLLEVCGGVLAEPEEWIGRVRRVLSGCPTMAYFFGSTNDGRRWLEQAHICERLNSLQWRVQFPGQRRDHASPMRALAFVAYVGDWWLAAQNIAGICMRLKCARTAHSDIIRNLMDAFCVPGYAHLGLTPSDRYYWPKFPFSDLVFFFQVASRSRDGKRMTMPPRQMEALKKVTFNGRGGRLPLLAFGHGVTPDAFVQLRRLDMDIVESTELPVHRFWRGALCPAPTDLTSYDSQVRNCMMWKHDVCLLKPPQNRSHGVSPLLADFHAYWRAQVEPSASAAKRQCRSDS